MSQFDFIVIGAGIAGASVAAELSATAKVALLEMEDRPGYHTTGRSAAAYEPNYGPPPFVALTRASGNFFFNTPKGFCDAPLFTRRGSLVLVPKSAAAARHEYLTDMRGVQKIGPAEIQTLYPIIRRDYAAYGLHSPDTGDLDVHALHQGFLRQFRQQGGKLFVSAPVKAIWRIAHTWQVDTPQGTITAPVVVNAAGAWGDRVAKLAGAIPIGLQAKRRSVGVVPMVDYPDVMNWPFVVDVNETWYAKPQSGKLLVSPADETPVEPHDAYADDLALAEGIERFTQATTVEVNRLEHSWGGLRNFTPDGSPAVGYDKAVEGFFWLVGQGGNGIMTAPAMARVAAALATHVPVPEDFLAAGLRVAEISPARFGK